MPEERFGRFRLEGLIGRGGMGEVYRAFDVVKKRVVAVKRLPPPLVADVEFQARFRRESELAARLVDPHVVPIYDYGEIDGQLYIEMQLVGGTDLARLLVSRGPLPPNRSVEIISQVAGALDSAHAMGLVHRDVKPSNVLLTRRVNGEEFVYLSDFGIARALAEATSLTLTGATVGTLAYMAPERFTGQSSDLRIDIYALACLLYECLTGLPPFTGEGLPALMYAHLNTEPPKPSERQSGVPPGLDAVIARGMAKQPERRYPRAGTLAAAARAALNGTVPHTPDDGFHRQESTSTVIPPRTPSTHIPRPEPPPAPRGSPPPPHRHSQRALLAVALVVALISAGAILFRSITPQHGPASSPPPEAGMPCAPPQASASGQPSTAPLEIGTLLPETGSLAFLGPPEFAAVDVAIKEINAAGGVLGNPVVNIRGDSGDDRTDTANQTVDRELGQGVQVIIGAAASGVTKLVIDKITGAGVVEFSPANTSDEFTCWPDEGLYFRTAPPDRLQAQALAALMAADGAQRFSILARNDPYGSGMAKNTLDNLVQAGIPKNHIQRIIYDPVATSYNIEVDDVRQFNPDAIAVIGFDESKKILTRMGEVNIGLGQKLVYGTDGNMGNALGQSLPPGLLNGMKGTTPMTKLSPTFEQRLEADDPTLVDTNYAGAAYDAVIITALAAEQAKSTKGVDIASKINGITKDGEKCTSFRQCRDIIDSGGNPDYDGVTGTLDFTSAGEPAVGSYGILKFNAQNKIEQGAIQYRIVGR